MMCDSALRALLTGGRCRRRVREPRPAPSTADPSALRAPTPALPFPLGSTSGSGCHTGGRVGGPVSSSCNQPPSWRGTATASGSTGGGSPEPSRSADAHLRRLLRSYVAYYNRSRPHQGWRTIAPSPAPGVGERVDTDTDGDAEDHADQDAWNGVAGHSLALEGAAGPRRRGRGGWPPGVRAVNLSNRPRHGS
jgi:hypothetical protein